MRSLGVLVRSMRSAAVSDDVIAMEATRLGGRVPADPRERRRALNRWEDAIGSDSVVLGAKRGSQREQAINAIRALGGRWVSTTNASFENITQLERQMQAVQAASAAKMWVLRSKDPDGYCNKVTDTVATIRTRAERDTPVLVPDAGTYEVDGVTYTARPVDVKRLRGNEGEECWNYAKHGSSGDPAYTCACPYCMEDRWRSQLLGAAGRNRPQPWHARLEPGYIRLVREQRGASQQILVMADAPTEHFEEAIARCRRQRDMSRVNVLRNLEGIYRADRPLVALPPDDYKDPELRRIDRMMRSNRGCGEQAHQQYE